MKKILIITTGGTIASEETPHGLIPSLTSAQLISFIPEIGSSIHLDTMAYTAAALSYLIQNSPKPVVLTGAQKPIGSEITDAKANLRDSIIYAADENSSDVVIVFDGIVIAGTRARKNKTHSFSAFSSLNYPELATIRDGRIVRYIREKTVGELTFYDSLNPRVFLMKLIPGQNDRLLKEIMEASDAIIIESFGVGGMPLSLAEEFASLMKAYDPGEKVVVMTTQVAYEGSDIGVYEVGHRIRDNMPILEARDMTNEAVLAKIMWLMAQDLSRKEIEELFYKEINHDTLYG